MQSWINQVIQKIEADDRRSSDTHLLKVDLPGCRYASLYLKDESTHPTASLKHRLARSLFLYGLCNGLLCLQSPGHPYTPFKLTNAYDRLSLRPFNAHGKSQAIK